MILIKTKTRINKWKLVILCPIGLISLLGCFLNNRPEFISNLGFSFSIWIFYQFIIKPRKFSFFAAPHTMILQPHFSLLFVCIFVCVPVCIDTSAYGSQGWTLGIFLKHSLPSSLTQDLSWNQVFPVSTRLPDHQAPRDLPVSAFPVLELHGTCHGTWLFMSARIPNTGPYAYLASTLPTEPSFWPHIFLVFFCP